MIGLFLRRFPGLVRRSKGLVLCVLLLFTFSNFVALCPHLFTRSYWSRGSLSNNELAGALLLFATIDKFGRVKCAVASYLLVAVFLIPVALEASGTFVWLYLALAFGTAGSSTTWVHTTELYSTDIRSTAHTLAFIVGRFGGFASGYVVENANSIPFATTVLIIMAALSALGTLTLRETMGERLS